MSLEAISCTSSISASVVYNGDCLDVLRTLDENSVDAVVTDPPYGLGTVKDLPGLLAAWATDSDDRDFIGGGGFMGKDWDAGVPAPRYWREILRVLKPGGYALVFAGTRTQDLMGISLRLAGFECRDTLMWVYGSGFPKSLDVSKAINREAGAEREANRYEGYGTAVKPAYEPILLCRKPLSEKNVARNVLKYGTGGLNIDGCRVEGDPWQAHRASGLARKKFFSDGEATVIQKNPHVGGRFPANIILDEEAGDALDEQSGMSKSTPRKPGVLGHKGVNTGFRRGSETSAHSDSGGASRFFKRIEADDICEICDEIRSKRNTMTETEIVDRLEYWEKSRSKSVAKIADGSLGKIDADNVSAVENVRVNSPQNKEGKNQSGSSAVPAAEKRLKRSSETIESIARANAQANQSGQLALNVKSAANLCDSCVIGIAQNLALMLRGSVPDSPVGLDSMPERKRLILFHCLALFAEMRGNTDITPTIKSLKAWFGYARYTIASTIAGPTTESCPSRFLYQSKASKRDRNEGLGEVLEGRNHHPTVKPTSLMQWLVRLVSPPGATVLDPFCGSGSTGKACAYEGVGFIGIELDAEYAEIARKRMAFAQNGSNETEPQMSFDE